MLTERDGKLYGRGSTDDKGPVLDWLNAIEAYNELKQEIPVNLKVEYFYFSFFLRLLKYVNSNFFLF